MRYLIALVFLLFCTGCDKYVPNTRQEAFQDCLERSTYRPAADCAEAVNTIYENAPNK